jgi:hypothetical protein
MINDCVGLKDATGAVSTSEVSAFHASSKYGDSLIPTPLP